MEPASTIIDRFGGVSRLAEITGVHRTRVSNWKRPKLSGGTGGAIPQKYHRLLIDYARKNAIELSADDFLAASEDEAA